MKPVLEGASKICVVRLSALGDVLHVLPALEALRRLLPEASFSWVVEDLSAPILEGHPDIERVWPLPRKSWQRRLRSPAGLIRVAREACRFFGRLRRERFAAALDFQGNLRGAAVARLSGAAVTVGFDRRDGKEGNHALHTATAPPADPKAHRVERNLQIPRFLGFRGDSPPPRLPDLAAERARARRWLGAGCPVILFHPGVSAFGAYKAWTDEGFAHVAQESASDLGAQAVLSWGPGDRDLVDRIAALAGDSVRVCPPTGTVRELAGFVAEADLIVAPDTGVVHLADALGRPVVALFGPKDPAIYGPRRAPHRVVRSGVDCSPCSLRTCEHRTCMRAITPKMVRAAMDELLGAS